MPESDLLTTYALAVARMRDLQSLLMPGTPLGVRLKVAEAEREVDALTALHLLPPIPPRPTTGEGGASWIV